MLGKETTNLTHHSYGKLTYAEGPRKYIRTVRLCSSVCWGQRSDLVGTE